MSTLSPFSCLICRYAVNFVPGLHDLLATRFGKTCVITLKEVQRVYGVYGGVLQANKAYPNAYLFHWFNGFIKGGSKLLQTPKLRLGLSRRSSFVLSSLSQHGLIVLISIITIIMSFSEPLCNYNHCHHWVSVLPFIPRALHGPLLNKPWIIAGSAAEIMMFFARAAAGVMKPNLIQFVAPNV